jgi:hypothetical protein
MSPIEVTADAIMHFEGWRIGSRSYRNRNPGNLRDSPYKIGVDANGYAVFHSLAAGYDALTSDLTQKASGHSRHNLNGTSTLSDLLNTYAPATDGNHPSAYTAFVCYWLTAVFGRRFDASTPLAELLPKPEFTGV